VVVANCCDHQPPDRIHEKGRWRAAALETWSSTGLAEGEERTGERLGKDPREGEADGVRLVDGVGVREAPFDGDGVADLEIDGVGDLVAAALEGVGVAEADEVPARHTWPLVSTLNRDGEGTRLASRLSLAVSGEVQSSSSRPPVSPELGLRHHQNWSVMPLDCRYDASALSHTPLLPLVVPPHSPITTALPVWPATKPQWASQIAGMLLGKLPAEKYGWLYTAGPYTCGL
jgi:hypothetical protein